MVLILTVAPHGNNRFTLRLSEADKQNIGNQLNFQGPVLICFENLLDIVGINAIITFFNHGRLSSPQINDWINESDFGHNTNLNEMPVKLIFKYENRIFSLYPRQYH